ncbi:MAG: hypothetical protein K8U57_31215 [Planctomycetes bacterium]|nr:hypothetical protein [Planctomycetota bacterium]
MENPFLRRASELLRDDEAFLAVVSPEPVNYHLKRPGEGGTLYDRLVLLRGTPGVGKTTLARLFEFPTLSTLLRNQSFTGHKELHAALSACRAIEDDEPRVLGCRLPMESDYRDFWEFPYSSEVKIGLMASLLQARTVLAWFRHLRAAGIQPDQVELITRPESQGVLDTIGGVHGEGLISRAADVENRIYKVISAIIAPDESTLATEVGGSYKPFDHIERIRIPAIHGVAGGTRDLIPLAIFDDAHVLHPEQFRALEHLLIRRELRIARWIIARFDVLLPDEALAAATEDRSDGTEHPGVTADRETEPILLQSSGRRREKREQFRSVAKSMASRYLRRMPLLNEKGLNVLGNVLSEAEPGLTAGRLNELGKKVSSTQKRLKVSKPKREGFEKQIRDYWGTKTALPPDVALAMLSVMMHRLNVRRGRPSPGLFDTDDDEVATESAPDEAAIAVAANREVYEAAVFHLFHQYDRPYFYGIDSVCDASSENAEQFLRLSAELVEAVATQLARAKPPSLTPTVQHKLLRERGSKIMEKWDFPQDTAVRRMVERIANLCLEKSLEPNGAIIANAFGIPQEEFEKLGKTAPEVARVLQFAVAYNAITLVPHYTCQDESWCLLELGGVALLKYGLTLKRGGFMKGSAAQLGAFVVEESA